jgi:hypothetical protein
LLTCGTNKVFVRVSDDNFQFPALSKDKISEKVEKLCTCDATAAWSHEHKLREHVHNEGSVQTLAFRKAEKEVC